MIADPLTPRIVQAKESCINDLVDFMCSVFAENYPNDNGVTLDMFEMPTFHKHMKDYLLQRLPNSATTLWLLEINNSIIASLGLVEEKGKQCGELFGFYVKKDYRDKGYGYQLWQYVMNQPNVKPLSEMHLVVAKNLKNAIKFYKRNGFTIVGEEVWHWPSWVATPPQNFYWKMEKVIKK
jgi:N-acetylglutamate synthase-like GNAT family acetyltransferase